jgi:hypothetical protein
MPAWASHCVPDRPGSFLYDDGTDVSNDVACDRVDDSADQAAERYYMR